MAADVTALPSKGADMSISEIRRFASDLQTNAALCAEIDEPAQAAHESLDGVIALATSKGYNFTTEELGASVRFASQILTGGELDRVTGAAPASIDPSIASLLKPWVLPWHPRPSLDQLFRNNSKSFAFVEGTNMSITEIRRFAGDMEINAALRAEVERHVQSSQSPMDGLVAFATGKGYGFTADDLGQSMRPAGKILSEGELDNVAGGGWNIWNMPQLQFLGLLLGVKG